MRCENEVRTLTLPGEHASQLDSRLKKLLIELLVDLESREPVLVVLLWLSVRGVNSGRE